MQCLQITIYGSEENTYVKYAPNDKSKWSKIRISLNEILKVVLLFLKLSVNLKLHEIKVIYIYVNVIAEVLIQENQILNEREVIYFLKALLKWNAHRF